LATQYCRRVGRQLGQTFDLDPAEEEPDQEFGQPSHRTIRGPAHGL